MDICFSLPRSIPAIAEKQTRKIAGTRSSKFVFYGSTDFATSTAIQFEHVRSLKYLIIKDGGSQI